MAVRSVTWIARRVDATQLPSVVAMAAALEIEVLSSTGTQVVLQTERGDVLEYCAPDHPVPAHLFARGATVLGFEVEDVDVAATAMAAAGFESLAETTEAGPVRYRHLVGPDGGVYGLITVQRAG